MGRSWLLDWLVSNRIPLLQYGMFFFVSWLWPQSSTSRWSDISSYNISWPRKALAQDRVQALDQVLNKVLDLVVVAGH